MQITIGGVLGAGKSTVAKLIAEKLGYKSYSMGAIRREIAGSRRLTIDEFNSLPENTDEVVDEYQKKLGKVGDNFVNEGRLAFYFMPESMKIYLHCDVEVAAARIFRDQRRSEQEYSLIAEVAMSIQKRMKSDRERYSQHYGVDCYDTSQFDRVIDTTNKTAHEVAEEILSIVEAQKK
ncbi:MAG TPA: AAA family ATPase [Nanoarchaeota archaeon]|nr:AAA family ATPase [Nanoarchaeota archaeon]